MESCFEKALNDWEIDEMAKLLGYLDLHRIIANKEDQ